LHALVEKPPAIALPATIRPAATNMLTMIDFIFLSSIMLSFLTIKLLDIAAYAILTNSTLFANYKALDRVNNNAYL
jgi:hypothetical protein